MMENLNKTGREGSFGQAARDVIVNFEFGHQGAKLLGANVEKTGVLALSEEL